MLTIDLVFDKFKYLIKGSRGWGNFLTPSYLSTGIGQSLPINEKFSDIIALANTTFAL